MLRTVIVLTLGVLAVQAGGSMEKKIKNKIDTFNIMSNCWGKKNMMNYVVAYKNACEFCGQLDAPFYPSDGLKPFQGFQSLPGSTDQIEALRLLMANPALANLLLQSQNSNSLYRNKRQSNGLFEVTDEHKEEFMENFEEFKMSMKTKIGNLTCVMTQLKMLDASGNINMRYYKDGVWSEVEKTAAAADPEFVQKMKNGYDDCYKISESWPQQSLDRNPLFKKYGRHMIFFECAKKVEHKMCYQYEMKEWIEAMYGPMEKGDLGYAMDSYDKATLITKVMYESASPEQMFVDEALWGQSKF